MEETLQMGEWGPVEELAVAATEVMRLRALLLRNGLDPDDPEHVPVGHIVYQPDNFEVKRGRNHETVLVEAGGVTSPIDKKIAPLMAEVWKAGIRTLHSCEDNPEGFVWLVFEDMDQATRFLTLVLPQPEPARLDDLYRRALRIGPLAFWPMSRALWFFRIQPQDRGIESSRDLLIHKGKEPDLLWRLSLRFPHRDLDLVTAQLRQHNS